MIVPPPTFSRRASEVSVTVSAMSSDAATLKRSLKYEKGLTRASFRKRWFGDGTTRDHTYLLAGPKGAREGAHPPLDDYFPESRDSQSPMFSQLPKRTVPSSQMPALQSGCPKTQWEFNGLLNPSRNVSQPLTAFFQYVYKTAVVWIIVFRSSQFKILTRWGAWVA